MRFAAILAFASALLAQNTGSIEGSILNTTTGSGLAGVRIDVYAVGGTAQLHTYTDDNGAFRLGDLAEGDYRVTFARNGFVPPRGKHPDPSVRVTGNSAARFDGALAPWPKLRGRVVDSDGKPASGAHVRIIPAFDGDTTTADDGTFAFDDLKPGAYVLSADLPGSGQAQVVTTYFPSTIERVQAREIQLEGGDDLSGFEIQLRSAASYKVRGVVLDTANKPVAGAKVTLFQPGSGHVLITLGGGWAIPEPLEEQHVQSGDDGTFEFLSAIAGEWSLRAEVSEYDEVQGRNAARTGRTVPVRVSGQDVDGLDVRIEDSFTVAVSVETDDPAKAAAARGPLGGINLAGLDGQRGGNTLRTENLERIFPGRYVAMPTPSGDGFYPAAILLGGRDVMGQEIMLTGPAELRVVYKSDGGSVRGSLKGGDRMRVFVFPLGGGGSEIAYAVGGGLTESFAFPEVPPGDYYIGAFERVDGLTPALLEALRSSGQRVHVEPRSVSTVDLNVIKP